MTRDERMALLLDTVSFYATNKTGDYGRKATAVLARVAEDECQEAMRKEQRMSLKEAFEGDPRMRSTNIMRAAMNETGEDE